MKSAISHQKQLAMRDFSIDDSCNVDAAFANDISTKLDDELSLGQHRPNPPLHEPREILAERLEIERAIFGKIGNAEATADVEVANGRWRFACKRDRQL